MFTLLPTVTAPVLVPVLILVLKLLLLLRLTVAPLAVKPAWPVTSPLNVGLFTTPKVNVLFAPPSVKGWDGGPAWLNGQTLLFRQNLALALTSTEDGRFGSRCDPVTTLAKHNRTTDDEVVDFLLSVFLQNDTPPDARAKLLNYLNQTKSAKTPIYWTREDTANHRVRTVAHLTLTLPEFQLA